MKIRTDFVTNSSSSSFLIVFENKDEKDRAYNELLEQEGAEIAERIFKDIDKYVISRENMVEMLKRRDSINLTQYWRYFVDSELTVDEFVAKYGMTREEMLNAVLATNKGEIEEHIPKGAFQYACISYEDKLDLHRYIIDEVCPYLSYVYGTVEI